MSLTIKSMSETKERISKTIKAEKGYLVCPFCGKKKYASVMVKCPCSHQVWEDSNGNAEYKGHMQSKEEKTTSPNDKSDKDTK